MNGEWLCKVETEFKPLPQDAEKCPVAPQKAVLHWQPVPAQYNAMLHPLIPYGIKGVAWYQGESNVGNPRYKKHLGILIKDWRKRWGIGDFPFYICQLPGFGNRKDVPEDSAWARCREVQASMLELPNTGIANLIDTCEDGDLHPLNKQDAGYRLALVALANTYGFKNLDWCGPVFASMKIQNNKAIITFSNADDGLAARELPATCKTSLRKPDSEMKQLVKPSPNSQLQGFALCGEDRNWVWADAKIDGTTVVVWSDKVPKPVAVRYAWADHPVCNLYNKAGLPAYPFRTDTLPFDTTTNK
jgi:sialate O-acetylesterase